VSVVVMVKISPLAWWAANFVQGQCTVQYGVI